MTRVTKEEKRPMIRSLRILAVVLTTTGVVSALFPAPAAAQNASRREDANRNPLASLPPALRAAVQSGNPDAIRQAITTLSGGDAAQTASLANQVVRAAEQIFATDPKGAIAIAQVAVTASQAQPVQQSSPQQSQDVITTAARLFINPVAQRVAPDATAALAVSSMQAAANSGNATLQSATASQAVNLATGMLASNAAAAVSIASAAMQTVKQDSVMAASPQQSMQTATAAARIAVTPEAQAAAPREVATMAAAVSQVVTNQAVYQSNPSGAIAAMAQAYAAVSTTVVAAAAPSAAATMTQTLTQAATSTALNQANAANDSQVTQILTKQSPVFQQALAEASAPTTTTTNNNNRNDAPIEQNKKVTASGA